MSMCYVKHSSWGIPMHLEVPVSQVAEGWEWGIIILRFTENLIGTINLVDILIDGLQAGWRRCHVP
jgi:hypothetical protein